MDPTEGKTGAASAAHAELRPGELHGDRLIAGLWIAMALALGRALLQVAVDATADGERGATLAEHLLEHLVDATSRVWLIVPPLAVLPRGRTWLTAALRAVVAFALGVVLLAGWPDEELRYRPGVDSTRGLQGWAAIAALSLAIVALDRYVTSPHRRRFSSRPAARFVATAAVLLLGGGALATLDYALDRRRLNMEVESIVVDLLDELPRARRRAGAGGREPEAGSILAEKGEAPAGGNKPSLVVPPGGEVAFEVDLPRYTSLSFSYAVDRAGALPKNGEDPELTFAVAVDGTEVFAESARPISRPVDRGWRERKVPLTFREERRTTIALRLRGEGGDLAKVRAGFGRPLLVRREWRPRVPTNPTRMNVVLVVVDSLRADRLGCYGCARQISPQIDRLAADSVVFERACAPSSWVWPSVASLLTGLWPPTHGVVDSDRCFLSDSLVTIAERFAQRGCTTLGVTACPFVTHTKNFQQGFEEWREFPLAPAQRVGGQFRDWVRRYSGYQFFAYVHFNDPSRPWNPPARFATQFASEEDAAAMRHAVNEIRAQRAIPPDSSRARGPIPSEADAMPRLSSEAAWIALYEAEVAFVDFEIGRMRRALEDERLLDRTIFVVTGPHGETLAAGPAPPLGASLAPELLHVPLIVRDPRERPRRDPGVVDLTGLAATLIAITGADGDEGEAGVGAAEAPLASAGARAGEQGIAAARVARAPMLPPWSAAAPRVACAHTARALLPGREARCELVGLITERWRLTMEPAGAVVEFSGADAGGAPSPAEEPGRASGGEPGPGAAQQLAQLKSQLARWYEECGRAAVSRPFQKIDFATQALIRDVR